MYDIILSDWEGEIKVLFKFQYDSS